MLISSRTIIAEQLIALSIDYLFIHFPSRKLFKTIYSIYIVRSLLCSLWKPITQYCKSFEAFDFSGGKQQSIKFHKLQPLVVEMLFKHEFSL